MIDCHRPVHKQPTVDAPQLPGLLRLLRLRVNSNSARHSHGDRGTTDDNASGCNHDRHATSDGHHAYPANYHHHNNNDDSTMPRSKPDVRWLGGRRRMQRQPGLDARALQGVVCTVHPQHTHHNDDNNTAGDRTRDGQSITHYNQDGATPAFDMCFAIHSAQDKCPIMNQRITDVGS